MAVSSQCMKVKSIAWPSAQPGHRVPLVSSVSFPVPPFPHHEMTPSTQNVAVKSAGTLYTKYP